MLRPDRVAAEGETTHSYEPPIYSAGSPRTVLLCSRTGGAHSLEVAETVSEAELCKLCGVEPDRAKSVFLGWPEGRFVPYEADGVLTLDCETVYVAEQGECAVELLSRLASDLRNSSCGRCVFGREGTYQLNLILSDLVGKKGQSADLERLDELSQAMETQSVCTLGQCAGRAIQTALTLFREELEAHLVKKVCPSLTCKAYISYYIDPTLCTGCGDCVDCCEEEAIDGRKGFIHILDRTMCERCGTCVTECPVGAIKAQSGGAPRLPVKPIPCGSWK